MYTLLFTNPGGREKKNTCWAARTCCFNMMYPYFASTLSRWSPAASTSTCALYYAAAPVAGGAFLLMTIALLITSHICRKMQQHRQEEMFRLRYAPRSFNLSIDERLATVNTSASGVRVQPVVATAQTLPRLSKQTTFKRYGAISPLKKFWAPFNCHAVFNANTNGRHAESFLLTQFYWDK